MKPADSSRRVTFDCEGFLGQKFGDGTMAGAFVSVWPSLLWGVRDTGVRKVTTIRQA